MKKLFYGLGAIAAVATPVVAVVSCGSKDKESGKIESLTQVFKDAGLNATAADIKAFETRFGANAEYEFEAITETGQTGVVGNRHMVIIRKSNRLTEASVKTEAQACHDGWAAATALNKGNTTALGGKADFGDVKQNTWKGVQLTDSELKDFEYVFFTNSDGHIRVRAIVQKTDGTFEMWDQPVFAINVTPATTK